MPFTGWGCSGNKRDPSGAWRDFRGLLPTVIGGILAICAGYYSSKFQLSSQVQLQKIQDQRQVFARLMGRKFTTEQLYVSRYEARIFSDYNEALWKLSGAPKDSLDLQEAQRWMRRSEDLTIDLAKNNQALFEDLGTVCALFPNTIQLRQLVERVYGFKSLGTTQPPTASAEEIKEWRDKSVQQLQTIVERNYGEPIDELLNYLSKQLLRD